MSQRKNTLKITRLRSPVTGKKMVRGENTTIYFKMYGEKLRSWVVAPSERLDIQSIIARAIAYRSPFNLPFSYWYEKVYDLLESVRVFTHDDDFQFFQVYLYAVER